MTWQQQLSELHEQWYRVNRPAVARDGLIPPCPKFNVKKTNDLQACIIAWVNYSGGAASRRSTTGTPRVIGGKTILVKAKKGAADIDATFRGITMKIEVKNAETKDTLKIDQWKEGQKIIAAGGLWFIATGIEMFVEWFDRVAAAVSLPDASLQPIYERPGGDTSTLPTLDEWRSTKPKAPKRPAAGDIIDARMGPPPSYVKHDGPNRLPIQTLYRYREALTAQGFKVAFRMCLYYTLKPEDKVYKRLPKGFTLQDTPVHTTDGLAFEKRVVDRNGAHALEWVIATVDGVTTYTRRAEMKEQFCIPEFIVGTPNRDIAGQPLPNDAVNPHEPGTVYVIDCKADTTDWKIMHYVKVLKFILAAKGDTRKVRGGVINTEGGIHKNFKV